jgi:amino acid adenylation domain-containing protein
MTEIADFVTELRSKGVSLWVEGDGLGLRAPKDVLTAELQHQLAQRKPAIVAFLAQGAERPIPRLPEGSTYELSHAQRRLWIIAQLDGGSRAYHIAAAAQLNGELDRDALARAFAIVGQRHEALRTSFVPTETGPIARVGDEPAWKLTFADLTAERDPDAAATHRARELAERSFDLAGDPLFRVDLVRVAPARHVLTLVMHHIISDGWSLSVLVSEIGQLYRALRAGRSPELHPLAIRYRDFAAWQRQSVAADRAYWLARLAPPLPVLQLPTDFARPPIRQFRGRLVTFAFDATERRALEQLARDHEASLFMVLCALVRVLLYRYTGQRDIAIGTPVAGRDHPDLEQQIGFFLNTLVLRDELVPQMPFAELLRRVRATSLDAQEHQAYPFDELVEELATTRDTSRSPLFDVQVSMQNAGAIVLQLDGITVTPLTVEADYSTTDLSFDFVAEGDELVVGIRYDSTLFVPERIAHVADHLRVLARSAIAQPEEACGRLECLPAAERAWLAQAGRGPDRAPPDATVVDLFVAQVRQDPGRVAVRCGEEALTYGELDAASSRLAAYLSSLRITGAGDVVVGVFVERTLQLPVTLLGLLKAGYAYVPLDPDYPEERIAQMLAASGAQLLVTEDGLCARLERITARLETSCRIVVLDAERAAIACHTPREHAPMSANRLAYVLYTSGSTGDPKGVEIEHGALAGLLLAMQRSPGLDASDVLLAVTTISFDPAGLELYLPLISGAQVVIASTQAARDGARLKERLSAGDVTVIQGTPSTFKMLLAAGWTGDARLKVLCGAEALTRTLAQDLRSRCGSLWNMYGPTETTIWSCVHDVREIRPAATTSIGRPIDRTRCMVLDAQLEPAPAGVPGELYIAGANVGRGYRGRPVLTAARFVADPYATGRMYRTGDLARFAWDGTLEFLGRTDHQVKVRGFRIETGEVEGAILLHPGVREAVVTCTSDAAGDAALCGYIAVRGSDTDLAAVRTHLEALLPAYMVPSLFVLMTALPRAANGKVDRTALPRPVAVAAALAPRTALESAIARIWTSVLELETVGVEDDFFAAGGHSLSATRVVFRIQSELGVPMRLMDLFRNRTVAALAAAVHTRRGELAPVGTTPAAATPEELELLAIDD